LTHTIEIQNIGKAYREYPSRWSRLAEWVIPGSRARHSLHWVLRDVNLQVQQGEALGIIGVNGAGKSTLLKIICGTTVPTSGHVDVRGRVTALLELGMGFHPDFTGRQNAIMTGQLQGLTADMIISLMPEIERFADIGDYIDQPIRIYSSGMQVRLAFAVATIVRPDLLIVDEALAVGDAAFQRKCFRKIEDYRAAGTSLLFVSHDTNTVKRLCDKAIFLSEGNVVAAGSAKQICDLYEESLSDKLSAQKISERAQGSSLEGGNTEDKETEREYGDRGATIGSVVVQDETGESATAFQEGSPLKVVCSVEFHSNCTGVTFGMMLKTVDGVTVYGTNTSRSELDSDFKEGQIVNAEFALKGNLVPGVYYLNVGVAHNSGSETRHLHRRVDCLILRVYSADSSEKVGYANLFAAKSVELMERPEKK
jgi:lipopolysaccharide transport system ATP-binding protein